MKRFKVRSINEWAQVELDEILQFPASASGRAISFDVNVSAPVVIRGSYDEEGEQPILVAASDGMFTVELATRAPLYLWITSLECAEVFVRLAPQDIAQARLPGASFTTLEPRRDRDPAMERMMAVMRLNAEARTAKLEAELARLKAALGQ